MRNKPVFSADQEQVAPARASRPDIGEAGWVGIVANGGSGSGQGLRLVETTRLRCSRVVATVDDRLDSRGAFLAGE